MSFSLGAYGIFSLPDLIGESPFPTSFPFYRDHTILLFLAYGLLLAIGIWAALVIAIRRFLGSSSYAPRAFRLCCYVALALPIVGIKMISYVNRHYDTAPGHDLVAEVVNLKQVTVTRRNSDGPDREELRYFATLSPRQIPVELPLGVPKSIQIELALFQQLKKGSLVTMTACDGFLGLPWYCDIYPSGSSDRGDARQTHR